MTIDKLQQRTTVNIQEKANLIWAIADKLVGTYKPQQPWYSGQGWLLAFCIGLRLL